MTQPVMQPVMQIVMTVVCDRHKYTTDTVICAQLYSRAATKVNVMLQSIHVRAENIWLLD
jgi:hypothetical protein